MSGFDHLKATYFEECAELLESAYAQLAALEEARGDEDTIHAIFRAIHSIKGGAGAFGFERLVAFAHVLESALDLLRTSAQIVAPDTAKLLVQSTDILGDLIAEARTGNTLPTGFESAALVRLQSQFNQHKAAEPQREEAAATAPTPRRLMLHIAPHSSLFRRANEPLLILRHLHQSGIVSLQCDISALPDLDVMDPETAYFRWNIELYTAATSEEIAGIFDFIDDCCDVRWQDLDTPAEQIPAHTAENPTQPREAPPQAATAPAGNLANATIRVDVEKVDRLVNLVGELVINQAMLVQLGGELPQEMCAGLLSGLETMSQHLRELQEAVMAVRAQPVKSVFARMPRLVRELAGQLGKDVRLVLSGEGTEIDKTVIEQLADPLTHMLRNALDHGIEMPDQRAANGKPRQGTIHLSAAHRSGRIVIDMIDDGAGINRPRVLAKARAQGLVAQDAALSDEEIDQLIFAPGFSTAEKLSDISGRGVGMDVVRRNIQALGGRVGVTSQPGMGSRFTLSLPLTLAILDGMIVAIGRENYIIPVNTIVESLRPKPAHIHNVAGHGDVLSIRGEYLPLVYLHRCFAVQNAITDPCRGIVVIVESEGDGRGRVGLVVDDLLTQQQVVVKSLEANYGAVEGIGGATILGDGRVALIIDVSRLAAFQTPQRSEARPAAATAPSLQLH